MRILSKESFSAVQPLLRDNYSNLYSRLSLQLPSELFSAFAKFTMLTAHNSGQWSIDCEGEDDFKPVTKASSVERMAAAHAFRTLSDRLKHSGVGVDVDRLLTVPDENCILYRMLPSGDAVIVLSQWGYRRVGSSMPVNNISLMTGGGSDVTDRVEVTLKLRFSDETPMTDTDVKVNVYGNMLEVKTDEIGNVSLGCVAVGECINVEKEGEKPVTLHTEAAVGAYDVVFPWRVNASVHCVDENNNSKECTLCVNGSNITSDADGMILIADIVLCKGDCLTVSLDGEHEEHFVLQHDSDKNVFTYKLPSKSIKVTPPSPPEIGGADEVVQKPLKVRIHVVDKKNRPLAYTPVRVELKKGFEETVTDADGYVSLGRGVFTQGEKVKVRVLKNSK